MWQQTKIYSALISWIPSRGGGTSQNNFDKEEKFRTKLFSTEMNLNTVSLTIGKGWCMMHKWTLNLNLHPSLLSFADGSFWTTQPQNASLPLNSKIGNLTQIDILWRGCFLCLMALRFPVWRPLTHQPPLAAGDLWWYLHLDYIPLRRPACSKSPSLALTALATPPSSLARLPNPHKTWVRPPYWDTDNIM